ncbi:hypothetical protein ACNQKP_16830 [Bdellovibrio bacteriovorus]|uniref:hypothetical protein n=1 Tax=Bdellovibrio bacteriovorus TaxID=959 RepID=UPI003AA89C07
MKHIIVVLALFGFMSVTHAEETVSEKVKSTANDVKRGAKKAMNRAEEAVCMEGDVKCLAKKGQNRVEEGADYVKDKVDEATDKK